MVQVLHMITLKGGEQVELLATPALFDIAAKRGLAIEADSDNAAEVYTAYTKLIYLAAINAWEVRRYDAPEMGEFPYRLMDFVEWATNEPGKFVDAMEFALVALTGKGLKDYANGEAKAPEKGQETPDKGEEEVKKKSASGWITRLFRRSS